MTYDELISTLQAHNIITQNGTINKQADRLLKARPILHQQLIERTNFLSANATTRARIVALRSGLTDHPTCKVCGAPSAFNNAKGRFNVYCPNTKGKSCAAADGDLIEQIEHTNKMKYGHRNPAANIDVRKKRNTTMLKKYGVDVPIHHPGIRRQIENTLAERYGVTSIAKIPGTMERRRDTNIKKYGAASYAEGQMIVALTDDAKRILYDRDKLEEMLRDFTVFDVADMLCVSVATVRKQMGVYGLQPVVRKTTTSPERHIALALDRLDIQYTTNTRVVIPPKELDFYIQSRNLAIEYNGIFFHSEIAGRGRNYHRHKYISCANRGIRLIQVWSSEWELKQDIVMSRLRNSLGMSTRIYARQCKCRKVDVGIATAFCNDNHIQGAAKSPIAYGLYAGDVLVAVMTFSKSRYTKVAEYELVRYCSLLDTSVVGGASKLFKQFRKDYNPTSVVSYCDLRWGTGNMYQQLGFDHLHDSTPNYFYFHRNNTNRLYSRIQFQKHKLQKQFPEVYDPALSEWEIMKLAGYDRVWDCGNAVYVWSVN